MRDIINNIRKNFIQQWGSTTPAPQFLHSYLDHFVASLSSRSVFFNGGFGDVDLLGKVWKLRKENDPSSLPLADPASFQMEVASESNFKFRRFDPRPANLVIRGSFESAVKEFLPEESRIVRFELLLPRTSAAVDLNAEGRGRKMKKTTIPLCAILPMTGDQGFALRKRMLGFPLLKEGIASLLIEIPFYGNRKAEAQKLSGLNYVSDLTTMGLGITADVMSCFMALKKGSPFVSLVPLFDFHPFCVTGNSLGGFMSSVCAVYSPPSLDVTAVPCVSPFSAQQVFCHGIFSRCVDFEGKLKEEMNDRKLVERIAECCEVPELLEVEAGDGKKGLEVVLNRFTNLLHAPRPRNKVIHILAQHDQYVSNYKGQELKDYYGEKVDIVLLGASHCSTALFFQRSIVKAIVDALSCISESNQ